MSSSHGGHKAATAAIFSACCLFFGVPSRLLYRDGRNQHRDVRAARHVVLWLLHESGLSYPDTSRAIGLGDHTTALYSWRKVESDERLHRSAVAIQAWLSNRAAALKQENAA